MLIRWEEFTGPDYYDPSRVPIALAQLETASGPVESEQAYNNVLSSIGNNHAGTLYPDAAVAVDLIMVVAIKGSTSPARRCAAAILMDMMVFEAEAGFETVSFAGHGKQDLTQLVREKIRSKKPIFKAITESTSDPNEIIHCFRELMACLND